MPDSTVNYHLEQYRLKAQIAALQSTIARQELEILELDDRKLRNIENLQASQKAITELETQLSGLVSTHGPATPPSYER